MGEVGGTIIAPPEGIRKQLRIGKSRLMHRHLKQANSEQDMFRAMRDSYEASDKTPQLRKAQKTKLAEGTP